jgi:hypothetical protein
MEEQVLRIVSWLGGEHWYVGNSRFLHLEGAIAYCERRGLTYEIVEDPHHYYKREGE